MASSEHTTLFANQLLIELTDTGVVKWPCIHMYTTGGGGGVKVCQDQKTKLIIIFSRVGSDMELNPV